MMSILHIKMVLLKLCQSDILSSRVCSSDTANLYHDLVMDVPIASAIPFMSPKVGGAHVCPKANTTLDQTKHTKTKEKNIFQTKFRNYNNTTGVHEITQQQHTVQQSNSPPKDRQK